MKDSLLVKIPEGFRESIFVTFLYRVSNGILGVCYTEKPIKETSREVGLCVKRTKGVWEVSYENSTKFQDEDLATALMNLHKAVTYEIKSTERYRNSEWVDAREYTIKLKERSK